MCHNDKHITQFKVNLMAENVEKIFSFLPPDMPPFCVYIMRMCDNIGSYHFTFILKGNGRKSFLFLLYFTFSLSTTCYYSFPFSFRKTLLLSRLLFVIKCLTRREGDIVNISENRPSTMLGELKQKKERRKKKSFPAKYQYSPYLFFFYFHFI